MVLALTLLGVSVAPAGEIDRAFAKMLENADPGQQFEAIIMMADQVDMVDLDRHLTGMNATRQFRHQVVVTRLMDKARATQTQVLRLLREHEQRGLASNIESVWLINAVLAKATPASLALVARQPEVSLVYDGGVVIELIQPFDHGPSFKGIDAAEPGIAAIKAPDLWAMGYEGDGSVVSNIDTGVAMHDSLKDRWRGNDAGVTNAEAWHDPYSSYPTPRDLHGHGTHTMGTICGSGGIGVAPKAKWIASGSIDRGGGIPRTMTDAVKSFQWSADPDGNPATIKDVPIVSSNSWGISPILHSSYVKRCDQTYWTVIDNAEYSGVAVVFAAGNEGTRGGTSGSLRTPADRIASPINVLAVGALNTLSTGIASFSSRGPSGCDLKTFKPDVCARGESVRSADRRSASGYRTMSGTSMACPHVAGAVALLHQVWPDATPAQLKTALLSTCDDLGTTGDDNVYGMGRINCLSAYNYLVGMRPVVSVSVMGTVPSYREGQTVAGHVVISNNTNVAQKFRVELGFYFNGNPTSLIILPPTELSLPGGFSNQNVPILITMPIPRGLPAAVLDPNVWSLRATVRKSGGGAVMHMAEYRYVITK